MKIKKILSDGYKVLPGIDRERYTEIPGLEGPFRTRSGKVLYYDPREGKYYDRDSDMYLSHEEFDAYDRDTPMEAADVADFGAAMKKRDTKRRFDARQQTRMDSERMKSEMFSQIDNAVAGTIDFLVQQKGMDERAARKAVGRHLSDLAMLDDLMDI